MHSKKNVKAKPTDIRTCTLIGTTVHDKLTMAYYYVDGKLGC